jgi:glycosyltransferase involved in cell wall biosynthesis
VKTLFVTQVAPDPSGGGSHRRAAQHLIALASMGSVAAVLPIAAMKDPSAIERARSLGADEVIVRDTPSMAEARAAAHASARTPISRAHRALKRLPYLDGRARPTDRPRYHHMLAGRFDLLFAFRLQSALWADSIFDTGAGRPAASVVDFDDIESIMFKETAVGAGGHSPFWRWKLNRDLHWLRQTERKTVARWTAGAVCSPLDSQRMAELTGHSLWVVPNSYEFSDSTPERVGESIHLLFVGTLSYVPNAAGLRWFMSDVWPTVRQRLGARASFAVVGYSPPEDIVAFSDTAGVSVVADAPSVRPYYQAANIVIIPLLAGSGTRIKAIEAAAERRAIVTTTLGCEGLDFSDGVHVVMADSASDFAEAIVRLAHEPTTRLELATAARAFAEEHFSAQVVRADLQAKLSGLLGARRLKGPNGR